MTLEELQTGIETAKRMTVTSVAGKTEGLILVMPDGSQIKVARSAIRAAKTEEEKAALIERLAS